MKSQITHGNSGGPLLDKYGKLIGINSGGLTEGQNINFAIPIGRVASVQRGSALSLADVRAREHGGSSAQSSEVTDDGSVRTVMLGSSGGHELQISTIDTASVEVNEGKQVITYDYNTIGIGSRRRHPNRFKV